MQSKCNSWSWISNSGSHECVRVLRFRVLMESDKPDATVSLKGLEFIDVPALTKRDYEMLFFAYREGQYNTKVWSLPCLWPDMKIFWSFVFSSPLNSSPQVTFHNVMSGEYLFYLVTFEATSPGVLSTIKLSTTIRQSVLTSIEVENPLTTATCLTSECKCLDISAPTQHTVPGQSKVDTEDILSLTAMCTHTNLFWFFTYVFVPLFRVLWA